MTEFYCEPLGKLHDRQRFQCESSELESWFRQRARQDQKRQVSAVYVLVPTSAPTRVAGFYSLSATAVILSDLPEHFARKLPRYPLVPAILLGRFARDVAFPGLGRALLFDALARALWVSSEIAAAAVVVNAKNDHARQFYARHGFESFPADSQRLFLPIDTVKSLSL